VLFFDIITIFPEMFRGVIDESIVKRALEKKLIGLDVEDLRNYTTDKHSSVDDYLYGGIPGMLMQCGPWSRALLAKKEARKGLRSRVIYLSPQGRLLTHGVVRELASLESLILVCGRYKGIDQRIIDEFVDDEISVGDYVVSGGELPAMLLVDAVTRLLPGVLSDTDSAETDSLFSGLLESPNYTRPELFNGRRVPEVLLSGHHENIRKWRLEQSREQTKRKRPDLYEKWSRENKE
jgi:tRNA (guanine37-N1)-methyltransferase